jgi:hypothetical protein
MRAIGPVGIIDPMKLINKPVIKARIIEIDNRLKFQTSGQ